MLSCILTESGSNSTGIDFQPKSKPFVIRQMKSYAFTVSGNSWKYSRWAKQILQLKVIKIPYLCFDMLVGP